MNNYMSGGETGEEEEEVGSAGKRRDEFPFFKPVPTCTASAGPGIPRSGEERGGHWATSVMMGDARVGGDFPPLFLWDTSRIFRAPSVHNFEGGFRNSCNTHKNRGLDGASLFTEGLVAIRESCFCCARLA